IRNRQPVHELREPAGGRVVLRRRAMVMPCLGMRRARKQRGQNGAAHRAPDAESSTDLEQATPLYIVTTPISAGIVRAHECLRCIGKSQAPRADADMSKADLSRVR